MYKTNNYNSKLFGNYGNNNSTKVKAAISLAALSYGVGQVIMANSIKHSSMSARNQMKSNAEYQTRQVSNIMGNNALNYLKSGVGISGSALAVISQNQKNGLANIQNELSYQREQIRDNLTQVRNQSILGLLSTATNIAFMSI